MLIRTQVPLACTVWFATGGSAQYYSEPTTYEEVAQAIAWARERQLPVTLLGHGANVLISDDGIPGLAIRLALKLISPIETPSDSTVLVCAQAGVELEQLITWCLERGIGGLEDFSGIPGTVGGSVFINIHYFKHLLSDYIVGVKAIDGDTGMIVDLDKQACNFGYNQSLFVQKNIYVLSVTLQLTRLDPVAVAYARGRSYEIIRHRRARYPYVRTCGSFFRNFLPHEVTLHNQGAPVIWVAYYLDQLGLKGQLAVGGARVSYQHANMIVTQPGATSDDVIAVARQMQQAVIDRFGIIPQAECQFLGFPDYPLLRSDIELNNMTGLDESAVVL